MNTKWCTPCGREHMTGECFASATWTPAVPFDEEKRKDSTQNRDLNFVPAPVGNRFRCTDCGGEQFFIASEAEYQPKSGDVIDNIECTGCHLMFDVSVRTS